MTAALASQRRLFGALLVAGAVWSALAWSCPASGQFRLFGCMRHDWLCDYRYPRECAAADATYRPETIERKDACYPPLAYRLAGLFPRDVRTGGILFASLAFAAFALALGLLAPGARADKALAVAALALSGPMMLAVSTANQILLAAAGVFVFFAFRHSPRRTVRALALAALALAAALKVIPALFALVLVRESRWREFLFVAALAAVFAFVPFVGYGGFEGLGDYLENLKLHAEYFNPRDAWGFVALDRSVRLGLGLPIESVRATYLWGRLATVAVSLGCLVAFFRGGRLLPLAAATLMLPGGSMYYTALLLIPALFEPPVAKGARGRFMEAALWFLVFCPLQLPVGSGSANHALGAASLLALAALELVQQRDAEGGRGR